MNEDRLALLGGLLDLQHSFLPIQPIRGLIMTLQHRDGKFAFGAAELLPHRIRGARRKNPALVHHAQRRTHLGQFAENVRTHQHAGPFPRNGPQTVPQLTP